MSIPLTVRANRSHPTLSHSLPVKRVNINPKNFTPRFRSNFLPKDPCTATESSHSPSRISQKRIIRFPRGLFNLQGKRVKSPYTHAKRSYSTKESKNALQNEFERSNQRRDVSMGLGLDALKKNLEVVVPPNGLDERLQWSYDTKTPLRVKLGFDPTSPDLHLGHSIVLKKLHEFQMDGHKIVVIIGDFTASIGDPTGRNKTRPPLSKEDIDSNAKTYLSQLSKIIDISKAEIRFNSEWFDKLNMRDVINLVSKVTLSQILQRDDFNNRYKQNIPIHFHELLYPIIQGYDSLMIDSDVEMGGTDQLFNCLVGRDLQSIFNKKSQVVACVPILRGTDGHQKMSKSLKNYVGFNEDPNNMYGKVMSIPDHLIEEYARLVANFSPGRLHEILFRLKDKSINPMHVKKEIAQDIVRQFHGNELAVQSAEHFYKQVQSRDENVIEFTSIKLKDLNLKLNDLTLLSLCAALASDKSKGELRRIIQGGGVEIDSKKIIEPSQLIKDLTSNNFKIKIGKRIFFEIIIN